MPNRSNSACESSTQNEKIKYAAFHSTRHSSLQRSDCDIRPKSSLYRGAASKQSSPVRGPHVAEQRRYSPRKPLSPAVSFSSSHSKKPPEASGDTDHTNANVSAGHDRSMSSDRRGDGSAVHDGVEANAIPAVRQSSAVDEDRSSSVNIPPDSVSRGGRGGGGAREDVGTGEAGGGGASSHFDASTSSATAAATTTARAAVTIPAVITTTSDNVVYTEALASVEAGLPSADVGPPMAPRRLPSADDDDDKERAVDTSPDGR